jgi:hypothetical protein
MKTAEIKYQVQSISETETDWTPLAAEYDLGYDARDMRDNKRKAYPKHKFRVVKVTIISEVVE